MTYLERLYAPAPWWIAVVAFAGVWGWIFWVATTAQFGLVVTVAVAAGTGTALARYGRATIAVEGSELRVGPAHVDLRHLGAPEPLDAQSFRAAMGPSADARAFVFTRPYIKTGLLIPLTDPRDPAPYWLVTTRRSAALAAAIGQTETSTAEREGTCGEEV